MPDEDSAPEPFPAALPADDSGPVPSSPAPDLEALGLPADDAAPPDSDDGMHEAIAAYLAEPATQKKLRGFVKRLPFWGTAREDAVQDIAIECLEAKKGPRRKSEIPAWVGGITRNVVSDAFLDLYRQNRWIVRKTPQEVDEIEVEPEVTRREARWLVSAWLREQVAGDPPSAETYWMLVDIATNKKTYKKVAEERRTTEGAIKLRVHRLKAKYEPEWQAYKRKRDALRAVLVVFGAGLLIALIVLLVSLFSPPPAAPVVVPWVPRTTLPTAPPTGFRQALPPPTASPPTPIPRQK